MESTVTQYITALVLAFVSGSGVGFLCAVFTLAPRLPPREPDSPLPEFDTEFWKRKRIHITRTNTKH